MVNIASNSAPSLGADFVEDRTDNPEVKNASAKAWAANGDTFVPCERTEKILPAGQYVSRYRQDVVYFEKKTINLDEIIPLPDDKIANVLDSMADFWEKEDAFREMGFLWKRGILLWGPPGGGKTSTVQQISKQIIESGGISLYCTDPHTDAEALRMLRRIEPNRPLVVIMEDIDSLISMFGESHLLAMLDGELQVDNIVFIATTNYPERMDKRFINRPSRFDEIVRIDMPDDACREAFIKAKNHRIADDEEMVAKWVRESEDFSIAHLKELIVSVECLGNDFDATIKRLRDMSTDNLSSLDEGKKAVGFL